MDATPDAWAAITHQRFLLRRLAQRRALDLDELVTVARRLTALGERVRACRLVTVSHAILAWSTSRVGAEQREQGGLLLLELSDAVDEACATRGAQSFSPPREAAATNG